MDQSTEIGIFKKSISTSETETQANNLITECNDFSAAIIDWMSILAEYYELWQNIDTHIKKKKKEEDNLRQSFHKWHKP